jgi:hypothetical protein
MWFPVYIESNEVLSGPSMRLLGGGIYATVIIIEVAVPTDNVSRVSHVCVKQRTLQSLMSLWKATLAQSSSALLSRDWTWGVVYSGAVRNVPVYGA